ncbi:MAG: hypothetical protein K2X03_25530 [Bryobacteraceae bacterium]|nr:hypothetical protein [Bryobacteraceae bacterium]
MNPLNALTGLFGQYLTPDTAHEADAPDHFDQMAQHAPTGTLAEGIAAALQSKDTPPFAEMAAQLFSNGDAGQKASMLNALLPSLAPSVLEKLGLGSGSVTADQAAAAHAESSDPSILGRMSSIYAEHPTLVKTLGATAMIIAMRKIAERYPST